MTRHFQKLVHFIELKKFGGTPKGSLFSPLVVGLYCVLGMTRGAESFLHFESIKIQPGYLGYDFKFQIAPAGDPSNICNQLNIKYFD
jgi:hypothetical protein